MDEQALSVWEWDSGLLSSPMSCGGIREAKMPFSHHSPHPVPHQLHYSEEHARPLHGKHSNVERVERGMSEPAPREWDWHSWYTAFLVYDVVVGMRERRPPTGPYHIQFSRGLTLTFIRCSTREGESCPSSGQHSGADPIDWREGQPAWRAWEWEIWSYPTSTIWQHGQGRDARSLLHHLHCLWQVGSLSQGHKSGRAIPTPHQLQHMGGWSLHLTWATE